MNTHELAWAAGFFDGEGYAGVKRSKRRLTIGMSVTQTERTTLERFQTAVLGLGRIYEPTADWTAVQRSPQWRWQVQNWRDMQAVYAVLWNYLSAPKREQIRRAVLAFRALPDWGLRRGRYLHKIGRFCRRGHAKTPENTYVRPGQRRGDCIACRDRRFVIDITPA